jgi:hypothetical protein
MTGFSYSSCMRERGRVGQEVEKPVIIRHLSFRISRITPCVYYRAGNAPKLRVLHDRKSSQLDVLRRLRVLHRIQRIACITRLGVLRIQTYYAGRVYYTAGTDDG